MKAIRIHPIGGAEVLQMEEVARPLPASDEMVVDPERPKDSELNCTCTSIP